MYSLLHCVMPHSVWLPRNGIFWARTKCAKKCPVHWYFIVLISFQTWTLTTMFCKIIEFTGKKCKSSICKLRFTMFVSLLESFYLGYSNSKQFKKPCIYLGLAKIPGARVPARWYRDPGMNSLTRLPEWQCKQRRAAHFNTFHNAFRDYYIKSW